MSIPGAQIVSGGKKGRKGRQPVPSSASPSSAPPTNIPSSQQQQVASPSANTNSAVTPAQAATSAALLRASHPLATGVTRIQLPEELLLLSSDDCPKGGGGDGADGNKVENLFSLPLSHQFLPVPKVVGTWVDRPNPALQAGMPRGLVNGANACFVAAVLQILLQLPSFTGVCVAAAAAYSRKCMIAKAQAKAAAAAAAEQQQQQQQQQQQGVAADSEEARQKKSSRKNKGGGNAETSKAVVSTNNNSINNNHSKPAAATTTTMTGVEPTASLLGRWMLSYWQNSPAPLSLPALKLHSIDDVGDGSCSAAASKNTTMASQMSGAVQQDAHEFLQLLLERIDADCRKLGLHFTVDPVTARAVAASTNLQQQQAAIAAEQQRFQKGSGNGGGSGWVTVGKGKERAKVRNSKHLLQHSGDGGGGDDDENDESGGGGAAARQRRLHHHHPSPSSLIFGGEMFVQVKGGDAAPKGQSARLVEPFLMLMAHVSSGKTVSQCIAASLAKEVVSSAAENISDMTKQSRVARPPHYALLIHLTRWAVTNEGDVIKLDNSIAIDPVLTIRYDAGVGPSKAGSVNYRLKAVLCHRGRLPSSGHYVTYVISDPSSSNSTTAAQQKKNDNKSASSSSSSSSAPGVYVANDARVAPVNDFSVIEKDSPYMLCYVRE